MRESEGLNEEKVERREGGNKFSQGKQEWEQELEEGEVEEKKVGEKFTKFIHIQFNLLNLKSLIQSNESSWGKCQTQKMSQRIPVPKLSKNHHSHNSTQIRMSES